MSKESALLLLPALAAPSVGVPFETTVRLAVSHTRNDETRLPADVPPATLGSPPSGKLVIHVDPRETLVHTAAQFVAAAARALPHDSADERLVAERVEVVFGNQKARPLTRRLPR
ncbi:MAG TPA: hypothetical protein VHC69_07765 [Polyangiaceae bacterium]|nr:hypothetical protein [Polyangiaceae bacterium]